MERISELLASYKYPLLIALVGSVLIFSGSITSLFSSPQTEKVTQLPKESLEERVDQVIKVDIAGAITNPGLYEISKEGRVADLLEKSGGFTPDVHTEFVAKNLNLSQKLLDGQKIYIPFKGESIKSVTSTTTTSQAGNNEKISINNASQSDLESLPGIGPSTASKIIASRPYESIDDLILKKAVGKTVFEKIKAQISL